MAISVVLATLAGIVIVAITTSGNDSFEDAGASDSPVACAPNEIRNQALESKGISGTHPNVANLTSDTIGCQPYCATWEYPTKGANETGEYEHDPNALIEASIGGPEGEGGVYSSNTGCFAPCYWEHRASGNRPSIGSIRAGNAGLTYDDSNRAPRRSEVRLGVVYTQPRGGGRIAPDYAFFNHRATPGLNLTPIVVMRDTGRRSSNYDDENNPIGAYTHKPNWQISGSGGTHPNWHTLQTSDHIEVRVDPYTKTCAIVDSIRDIIICSSEDNDCDDRQYPDCHLYVRHANPATCPPADLSPPR